jgi:HK97 family phage major capsid protein
MSTITKNLERANAPLIELTDKEQNQYSISRAILTAVGGFSCFEREVSDEIARRLKNRILRHSGIFVPTSLRCSEVGHVLAAKFGRAVPMGNLTVRAGLDSITATKGAELRFTAPATLIEALRAKTRVITLGATFLEGLREDLGFPKLELGIASEWVADNPGSSRPAGELTLASEQVPLKASSLQSPSIAFSRQLLVQSTPAIDGIVANDVAQANATAIDRAALHGSGVGPEPLGIYNAPGVTPIAFGGVITHSKIVAMEKAVAVESADVGPCGYITTPEVRANARETQVFAGNGGPLWTGDNEAGQMNYYTAFATNQVRKDLGAGNDEHGIVFGAWRDLIIGEFGATELVVDQFTSKKRGMIEVNSFLLAGLAIAHGESFSAGTGLTVS